jgi:hypothetical protein
MLKFNIKNIYLLGVWKKIDFFSILKHKILTKDKLAPFQSGKIPQRMQKKFSHSYKKFLKLKLFGWEMSEVRVGVSWGSL